MEPRSRKQLEARWKMKQQVLPPPNSQPASVWLKQLVMIVHVLSLCGCSVSTSWISCALTSECKELFGGTWDVLYHIAYALNRFVKRSHSPFLRLLVLAFLERHEIKMALMTHCFDISCRNHAMKFLCHASKCTFPRIFLMSLLCSITSDRACWLLGRHQPLKSCFPVRLYPGSRSSIKQTAAPFGVCNILIINVFDHLVIK